MGASTYQSRAKSCCDQIDPLATENNTARGRTDGTDGQQTIGKGGEREEEERDKRKGRKEKRLHLSPLRTIGRALEIGENNTEEFPLHTCFLPHRFGHWAGKILLGSLQTKPKEKLHV